MSKRWKPSLSYILHLTKKQLAKTQEICKKIWNPFSGCFCIFPNDCNWSLLMCHFYSQWESNYTHKEHRKPCIQIAFLLCGFHVFNQINILGEKILWNPMSFTEHMFACPMVMWLLWSVWMQVNYNRFITDVFLHKSVFWTHFMAA